MPVNQELADLGAGGMMKIAILSDIHDNVWNLKACVSTFQRADVLVCCGDLCSPFIVPILAQNFNKPIHFVLGNNDGDLYRITNLANNYPHFFIRGEFFEEEFSGKYFAVTHYDNIARRLAQSRKYDVVCFGHNHRYQVERMNAALLINPGAMMGYSPLDNQEIPATFVIYDTETDSARGYRLNRSVDQDLIVGSIADPLE